LDTFRNRAITEDIHFLFMFVLSGIQSPPKVVAIVREPLIVKDQIGCFKVTHNALRMPAFLVIDMACTNTKNSQYNYSVQRCNNRGLGAVGFSLSYDKIVSYCNRAVK